MFLNFADVNFVVCFLVLRYIGIPSSFSAIVKGRQLYDFLFAFPEDGVF